MSAPIRERCPFCGGGDLETRPHPVHQDEQVYCIDCGAHGPYAETEGDAWRKWNERRR
jgi:Lar family restriction alleviation protein